ncbi:FapA family protein [Vibrio hippocampi]|uniref:Flagellar Assembly Protein A N-terminal region domain-containing protein n=1 Tax=Vibrio hippocampi TaxID=654686 RepID=A0ABN8DMZ9_9VIBR|nr:FapA family protein [Vibrio hippocampi]CAH0528676.1 hypothetical protein VHP8226_02701 [Vibrio hippocampi]
MWKTVLSLSEDKTIVTAKLPKEHDRGMSLEPGIISAMLSELEADKFYLDQSAVNQFVKCAQDAKGEAFQGIDIAFVQDAKVEVILSEQDMLASMKVTGAYAGNPATPAVLINLLAEAKVVKGINKKALKKVILLSNTLKAGQEYVQPIAIGKPPKEGKDSRFVPLTEDPRNRVLKPQASGDGDKVDMRDLGAVVTVDRGTPVMKRIPAEEGEIGYTVTGVVIPPKEVKDTPFAPGKGTQPSSKNPNVLVAIEPGMPIIKPTTVDIDEAMVVKDVDISTGHIKFNGSVVISGNVEANMNVEATGMITVGGFVESATLKSQQDIVIGKGIIGHNVDDGEPKSCTIECGGNLTANYAQFSNISAKGDIQFAVHCLNNDIRCDGDLSVVGTNKKQGILSGGAAEVGGKVLCNQLGVEGDTATKITAFANYKVYADKLAELERQYTVLQERKMASVRREIELKKIAKSNRTAEQNAELEALNSANTDAIDQLNEEKALLNLELEKQRAVTTVEALVQTHTRVTVVFSEDHVTTKKTGGPTVFSYDGSSVNLASKLKAEDFNM